MSRDVIAELTDAKMFGHDDDAQSAQAAKAAGWTIDEDGWWVRGWAQTDPLEEQFFVAAMDAMGFVCEGRVYARTADVALKFDAARIQQ